MKKKKVALILIIALALLGIIIGIIIKLYTNIDNSENEKIQDVLEQAWYLEINEELPSFFSAIEERSSFQVTNVVDNGDGHCTITADVTSPDICQAIIDYQGSITDTVTQDEIDSELTKIIIGAELKTTPQEVTLIEIDGQYDVQFSDEFVNAMYGYTYTYAMQKFKEATTF